MTHYLTLVDWAFTLIKNKEKTIEMRLNDKKRRNIKRFDEIEFTNLKTEKNGGFRSDPLARYTI